VREEGVGLEEVADISVLGGDIDPLFIRVECPVSENDLSTLGGEDA